MLDFIAGNWIPLMVAVGTVVVVGMAFLVDRSVLKVRILDFR